MKLQQATQHPGTIPATALHAKLISVQLAAQRKGITLTEDFVQEILAFTKRNACVFSQTALHTCCPACLKAHALLIAHENDYTKETKAYLTKEFPGSIGHEGYYLDDTTLVKLPSF
ncbi:hypothetical protein FJZ22_01880 [Candidatus Pacearchaeota archaeon]|nr:hypothetical protein [Candidatus Pacearchaeota archaeon]